MWAFDKFYLIFDSLMTQNCSFQKLIKFAKISTMTIKLIQNIYLINYNYYLTYITATIKDILIEAKTKYYFYETPLHHSEYIYQLHDPKNKLKIIDICCGMGSLVDPWYRNNHDVTLIELNEKLIPFLQEKYPLANIINDNF